MQLPVHFLEGAPGPISAALCLSVGKPVKRNRCRPRVARIGEQICQFGCEGFASPHEPPPLSKRVRDAQQTAICGELVDRYPQVALLSNWPAQERGLETLPRRTGGAGRNEEGLSKFFWSYAFISKRLFGVDLITVFTSTRFVAPLLNGIEGRQYQVSADQLQIRNVPAQSSSLVVPKGSPPDWPQRYIALPETVSGTLL